jgi:hypothetical protein
VERRFVEDVELNKVADASDFQGEDDELEFVAFVVRFPRTDVDARFEVTVSSEVWNASFISERAAVVREISSGTRYFEFISISLGVRTLVYSTNVRRSSGCNRDTISFSLRTGRLVVLILKDAGNKRQIRVGNSICVQEGVIGKINDVETNNFVRKWRFKFMFD